MPELGRDRVLDRQRVDVARRQRQYGREDAADDLEEAPLRVRTLFLISSPGSDWLQWRLNRDKSAGFRFPRDARNDRGPLDPPCVT